MNEQNQKRYQNYNMPNNKYNQVPNNTYPYQQQANQNSKYINPQQIRYNQNISNYNRNTVPNYNNMKQVQNNKGIKDVKENISKKVNNIEDTKKENVENEMLKTVEIEDIDPEFVILNRYGENLTKKEYVTNPAIAREEEIGKLILVLLTPDKSACLVGKPGIGKTAIVEGLAYRILHDKVPNILKGYRIINVATSSLLGESINDGEKESRIQLLVNEVMKSDKIILFIDEIHTLMGAGAKDGSALDFANILKPALARGNVKLIGATTSDEYERYMIRDRAFIRRFEKIEVAEPDIPTTVKILMGSYPRIEKKTGVKLAYTDYIKEQLMTFIVEMTSEYKRYYEVSSRYPDISLALLSKAFSFAMYENSNEVRIRHFWMAINTCESIYPDSRTKEIQRFKTVFNDIIKEENLDVNAPINI